MKWNVLFAIVTAMVACTAGTVLLCADEADAAESATEIVYRNEGDSFSRSYDETISVTGTLPSSITLDKDEKGFSGRLITPRVDPYEFTVTVGADPATQEIIDFVVYVYRPIEESESGWELEGYGTESDPWTFHTYEGRTVSFDFRFYGEDITGTYDLPSGLTVNGSVISGTIDEGAIGTDVYVLSIGGHDYYFELSVTGGFPSAVIIAAIVIMLVLFVILVLKWTSKPNLLSKKGE